MHGDDDPTVRVRRDLVRPAARSRSFAVAAALLLFLLGAGGAWLLLRPPGLPPVAEAPARFAVTVASEATILDGRIDRLTYYRLDRNPDILVLDFVDLRQQGLMLNRVAALSEKIGLPRDRVLRDDELDAAIVAAGDTVESYYYGHDYPAVALLRFFALAERDSVVLNPEEETLRAFLRQEGFFAPGSRRALISIPRVGGAPDLDSLMRATILRHELSHAEFFSNPVYADYVRQFWARLDAPVREAFARYLTRADYDPAVPDLHANEMQAYLLHTRDRRLFTPDQVGLSADAYARLQAEFLLGMPPGWLRDCTVAPAVVARP